MQRQYAMNCPDEPWPTFMVKNKYCLDNTEEGTIYIPNEKHRVPYINILEKPTTTKGEQTSLKQIERDVKTTGSQVDTRCVVID